MIGQILKGTYRLYDKVGSGGFATVYLGRNVRTNQIVAVKVLKEESAAVPGMVERFRREAQMIQALDHPNLVRVLDYGVEDGHHFLVMDYIQGKTLAQLIAERGPLPVEQAVSYVSQICSALEHARQHGIVHRDIKPANLMVTPEDTVKVMDFGIAKIAAITALTHSGQSMGTPRYMSPEMAKGELVDIKSDIYSLGVVLYEMLAGKVPFDADSPWTVMRQHIETPPRPVAELRRGVPSWLAAATMRALAKEPVTRFQTPAEMSAALAPPPIIPAQPGPAMAHPAEEAGAAARRKLPLWAIGAAAGAVVLGLVGALVVSSPWTRGTPTPPLVTSAPASVTPGGQPTATLAATTTPPITGQPLTGTPPVTPGPKTSAPGGAVATATLALTPTASPTRLIVASVTRPPVSTAGPSTRSVPVPNLRDPNGETVIGPGVRFSWDRNGYALGPGEGYAVLAWKADDPQYQDREGLDLPALFDACANPYLGLSFDSEFSASKSYAGSGKYNWTVVVVDTRQKDPRDPRGKRCVVISDQPAPHSFTYSGPAPTEAPPPPEEPPGVPVPPPGS